MDRKVFNNHHLILFLISLLGFVLRAWGISEQPPLGDEVAAAYSATGYMENGLWSLVMWEHPPLRNMVLYLSGKLFGGYTAWGLRSGSILCGSLSALLLGYLSYSLFRNRAMSCLAAFFLCIDPLHIALSRQAFQECITAFFILAGLLAAYQGMTKDNVYLVYLSGALFGLASASKWHGLFPWAISAAAYVFAPWFREEHKDRGSIPLRLLNAATAYLVIPLAVYTAVFIPWLNRGYSLREFFDFQLFLVKSNYAHRASDYAESFLSPRAYLWFLWPTAWADFVFYQGKAYLDIAMGNFLVWVLTLPSFFFALREWLRKRWFELGLALALFLFSYLPLILTSRGIWVFSAPAVIPFAFLLSSYAIVRVLKSGGISRSVLVAYLVIVSLVSVLMYPLSTFRAMDYPYLKPITDVYSPHGQEHFTR